MPNELEFIFRSGELQKLLDNNPDFIVIKSHLEEAILQDGRKAGVLRVRAEAINKSNPEPLNSVEGCPKPPCGIDG